MDQIDNEQEMSYLLLEKDFDNRDSLDLIYDVGIAELLENAYAQKIVSNIWDSKYNVSHSIFSASSVHNLLFNYDHCRIDLERQLRFTNKKDLDKVGTHGFQFEVWRSSGKSRYITFAISFILNAILMHSILLTQISQGLYLKHNEKAIESIFEAHKNLSILDNVQSQVVQAEFTEWVNWIFTFEY
jgi:hypothetical protein